MARDTGLYDPWFQIKTTGIVDMDNFIVKLNIVKCPHCKHTS